MTYIEQVKFARKIAATEPFASVVGREVNPGPAVQTDEDISLWLKKYLTTVHHTSSSCSMLPREKGGVVDANLKVYGTTNLRVVDLSVAPLHFSAHAQGARARSLSRTYELSICVATVYAIAEQGTRFRSECEAGADGRMQRRTS